MASIFVDSSALSALVDEGDTAHARAEAWLSSRGVAPEAELVTHSYVVCESLALVRARLGHAATRTLARSILPAVSVVFVDRDLHEAGLTAHLAAVDRRPSFVDWVSFEMMRTRGIERAFAFDGDFRTQGFETVP